MVVEGESMAEMEPAGEIPVSELIGEETVRVSPQATLTEVAAVLAEANIGAVVVFDKEKLTGIVSERDIVSAIAEGLDPTKTRARDLANSNLIWCDATATVSEVANEMMERYVRHVLVEEDGVLIGVVSARDLLGIYAMGDLTIKSLDTQGHLGASSR